MMYTTTSTHHLFPFGKEVIKLGWIRVCSDSKHSKERKRWEHMGINKQFEKKPKTFSYVNFTKERSGNKYSKFYFLIIM